jgi:hypothetical protein
VGPTAAVGAYPRLNITERVRRCAAVSCPGGSATCLPRDPALLGPLADSRGLAFHVDADVMAPGAVTLGDRCTME